VAGVDWVWGRGGTRLKKLWLILCCTLCRWNRVLHPVWPAAAWVDSVDGRPCGFSKGGRTVANGSYSTLSVWRSTVGADGAAWCTTEGSLAVWEK